MSDKNTAAAEAAPLTEEAAEAAEDAEMAAMFDEVTAPGFGNNPTEPSDKDRATGEDAGSQEQKTAGKAAASPDTTEETGEAQPGAADAPSGASAPDDAASAGAAGSSPDQADIWSKATPEQKAAFEALQGDLQQYKRSNEGRLAAYQRRIDTLQSDPRLAGQAAPVSHETRVSATAADGQGSQESKDAWKGLEEEYGEIAEPLKKILAPLVNRVAKQDKDLAAIDEDRRESAYGQQAEALEGEHEGWQDFIDDNFDTFQEWLGTQPPMIQRSAVQNQDHIEDAREAGLVISLFKQSLKQNGAGQAEAGDKGGRESDLNGNPELPGKATDGRRKRQIESSTGVRPQGFGTGTGIAEEGDPEALFDQMEQAGMFNR